MFVNSKIRSIAELKCYIDDEISDLNQKLEQMHKLLCSFRQITHEITESIDSLKVVK